MSINSIQFTLDSSTMSLALSNGYASFSLEPLKKKLQHIFLNQEFGIVTNIPNSQILVCSGISGQSPFSDKVLCIYDEQISHVVLEIQDFSDTICNIYMWPKMFCVSTRTEVRLYTFDPPVLFCQFRTSPNAFGQCAFYCNDDQFIIAMTGRTDSMLRIVTSEPSENQDFSFECSQHGISKIVFNLDASLVATASSIGTIIRIWRTSNGEKIAEFRRGSTSAVINSMAFSPSSELLAVASNKKTLHIFDITNKTEQRSSLTWTIPVNVQFSIAFSSDGRLLCAFKTGQLYILDVSQKEKGVQLKQVISFGDSLDAFHV